MRGAPVRHFKNGRLGHRRSRQMHGHTESKWPGVYVQTVGRRSAGGGCRGPVQLCPSDRNDHNPGLINVRRLEEPLSNEKIRMTNAEGISKSEWRMERHRCESAGSDLENSGFFRHSSFLIWISSCPSLIFVKTTRWPDCAVWI